MAGLFNSAKMMLSVLHKELQCYLDIMKVQGIGKCVGYNELSLYQGYPFSYILLW